MQAVWTTLGRTVGMLLVVASIALAQGTGEVTGTITDAHPVRPGESWSTRLQGLPLPGLSLRFT